MLQRQSLLQAQSPAPRGGLVQGTICSDVLSSSFWEAGASWDAAQAMAQVLPWLNQGCNTMAHPGHK